jgi:hypothetical protein
MSDVNWTTEEVPPPASAMIESMRAYGYSTPMGIADLIDNSIFAGATRVWLNFNWSGADSFISIADNGRGMSEEQLVSAMKLGSQNPLEVRAEKDLGRFGLGLKTSSFSQCRCMSVLSLMSEQKSVRQWDLDFIAEQAGSGNDKWLLKKAVSEKTQDRLNFLESVSSGTVVLWENIDRIIPHGTSVSDEIAHKNFLNIIKNTEEYLAMIFHRYLEDITRDFKILINGTDKTNHVKSWNPFFKHSATTLTPEETIVVNNSKLTVQGFILPHKDRLGEKLHKEAAGPKGWNAQQGFYLYRNKRLLVAGSWLGLGSVKPWTQEEHYKLARIRIDIPNSMDQEWQIDVKKSSAILPGTVRERLTNLAKNVRQQAREVFSHRGRYGPRQRRAVIARPWKTLERNGSVTYQIDRSHPLVESVFNQSGQNKEVLEAMLEVIEETVPVQRIWLDMAEKPDTQSTPFKSRTLTDVKRNLMFSYEVLISSGLEHPQVINKLKTMEEYLDYPELIETFNNGKS